MFTWVYNNVPWSKNETEVTSIPIAPVEKIKETKFSPTKSVDFVLVYKNGLDEDSSYKKDTFLSNLQKMGFELETAPYTINPNVNFVKLHAPTDILLKYAEMFGVELAFRNVQYKVRPGRPFKFMRTILTDPDLSSPIVARAREAITGMTPEAITSAEKSLVVHKVLLRNHFGRGRDEFSIKKLIKMEIFDSAYPLHDGLDVWTDHGPLNDRQLLAQYWSTIRCWYKQQPLDLIERYYGSEISLYFAWLGFYNGMLIPLAILGVAVFFTGTIYYEIHYLRSKEICESDILLCPRCILKHCKYEPLKKICNHAKLMNLIDNPLVICFAAFTSLWSFFLVEFWRRKQAMLQIRWNLKSVEADYTMRPAYEDRATHNKISAITGDIEFYMSPKEKIRRYAFSTSIVILVMISMFLALFGIMIYVKVVSTILMQVGINVGVLAPILSSLLSLCTILIVDIFYKKLAMWLTMVENPRTQVDFNNSYIYKCYALAFVNSYSVIGYLAFFKVRFYTFPGDKAIWTELAGIKSMLCAPGGCIYDLAVQLIVVLLGKNLLKTVKQFVLPYYFNFRRRLKSQNPKVELQWERDYLLNPIADNHVMGEYIQMIIQYGFVICFIAAFPPAPFLALFNNLLEMRIDAYKLTHAFRRPVAFKVPNLGAWDDILRGITYLGIATNAFVIAFTSEFVHRITYKISVDSDLKGYVRHGLLSVFNVSDYPASFKVDRSVNICYYPSDRYPPDHSHKYQLTDHYWFILTIRLLVVVIFEHVLMMVNGVIAYAIPDVPFKVKQHINHQKSRLKETKMKLSHDYFLSNQDVSEKLSIKQSLSDFVLDE